MNPRFSDFKRRLASPFAFSLFLFSRLPSAFFAGLKLRDLTAEAAVVSVSYKWFNKNPFGSIYFAVLSMAAEASTGILCMSAVHKRKPSVSILIVKIEGNFSKKAAGEIRFTCLEGSKIQQAVEDAVTSGESRLATCESIGKNENGDIVANFFCTWSFKARSKNRDL